MRIEDNQASVEICSVDITGQPHGGMLVVDASVGSLRSSVGEMV